MAKEVIEGKEYHGSAFNVFGSPLKNAGDVYVTVVHISEPANVRDKRVVHFKLNRKTAHNVPRFFSMLEEDFASEFKPTIEK